MIQYQSSLASFEHHYLKKKYCWWVPQSVANAGVRRTGREPVLLKTLGRGQDEDELFTVVLRRPERTEEYLHCLELCSTASLTAFHWSVQKLLKSVASFSFNSLSFTNSRSSTGSYFTCFKLGSPNWFEIGILWTDFLESVVHVTKSKGPSSLWATRCGPMKRCLKQTCSKAFWKNDPVVIPKIAKIKFTFEWPLWQT